MSALAVTERAPSVEDACRAADELVRAGVGKVLLFGSVARGDATEHSDIDLVAIYDDLGDYRQRLHVQSDLEQRAREVAGWPVDVLVTDMPEWAVRTEKVPCSFEAGIASVAKTLADTNGHGLIDWDKEIGMPADEEDELARRFIDLSNALVEVTERLYPGVQERSAAEAGQESRIAELELARFTKTCDAVHHVFESAAKMMHIITTKSPVPYTHKIDELVADQPEWVRDEFAVAAGRVNLKYLAVWHQASHYIEKRPLNIFDETYLRDHVGAAIRIATFASRQGRENNINDALIKELDIRLNDCEGAFAREIRIRTVDVSAISHKERI